MRVWFEGNTKCKSFPIFTEQEKSLAKWWNRQEVKAIPTPSYKPPEAKNVDEYFDMGSIEIEIDGEADPEMVMAEVKEIIEERKRKLQEKQ